MFEAKKDLFECLFDKEVDAICITTNGQYSSDGAAIMGGGCAGEAARRWPKMPFRLGKLLKTFDMNIPFIIGATDKNGDYLEPTASRIRNKDYKCLVFSFPTINKLSEGADLKLIKQSSSILVDYVGNLKLKKVVTVRPGSGIGGLDYYNQVRPEIVKILDYRFLVVCQEHDELRKI